MTRKRPVYHRSCIASCENMQVCRCNVSVGKSTSKRVKRRVFHSVTRNQTLTHRRAYAHRRTREQGACAFPSFHEDDLPRAFCILPAVSIEMLSKSRFDNCTERYKGLYGSFFLMRSLFSGSIVSRCAVV